MKGNTVSVRLSRHSGEQAQTASTLLYSDSTHERERERRKGERECMCKHENTSHIVTVI